MSSFRNPHHLYLFLTLDGRKKLAYGPSPQEALKNLGLRLTAEELERVDPEHWERIAQRDLHKHVSELG